MHSVFHWFSAFPAPLALLSCSGLAAPRASPPGWWAASVHPLHSLDCTLTVMTEVSASAQFRRACDRDSVPCWPHPHPQQA